MLLQDIGVLQLANKYRAAAEASSCAHLLDASNVQRARRVAKKNGLWDRLGKSLATEAPLTVIKRSDYRRYRRLGDRSVWEAQARPRVALLSELALAVWLKHPDVPVDALQDLIWALCDEHNWVMPAHEDRAIDLRSAMLAASLATIVHVLADRLEPEVIERVEREIERRVFDPYFDHRVVLTWRTCAMNWNHVCNGSILQAALCLIKEPTRLATMTHPMIQNLSYAIEGFAKDGGCLEGPNYWNYGFGHFVSAAFALWQRTGGAVNIMQGPHIEAICRYPLAAFIDPPLSATFADASHGHISAVLALQINRFYDLPRLYSLCPREADGSLRLATMDALALSKGVKALEFAKQDTDAWLPDLGMVKLRGDEGPGRMTLMAIAGRNDVPHNHNDIGSFLVHRQGRLLLTDPGAPIYTAQTFSPRRYEIPFCSSFGHSVPVINGQLQQAGSRHVGTLNVENLNGKGIKSACIDMTRAYGVGVVQSLVRTLTLDATRQKLTLEDRYEFAKKPKSIEEAFVTFEAAAVSRDGRSVQLGPKRGGAVLRASDDTPGKFAVAEIAGSLEQGRAGKAIRRISFEPARLARSMKLRFEVG